MATLCRVRQGQGWRGTRACLLPTLALHGHLKMGHVDCGKFDNKLQLHVVGVSGVCTLPCGGFGVAFNVPLFAFRPATNRPAMSALRLVSSVARHPPRSLALGLRGYAEAADKIKLSLVLPHQVCGHISLLSCP
jgi:hypothetical protein